MPQSGNLISMNKQKISLMHREKNEWLNADELYEESVNYYLTHPDNLNLPAAVPLFLSVTKATTGNKAAQFAWHDGEAVRYYRVGNLVDGVMSWQAWQQVALMADDSLDQVDFVPLHFAHAEHSIIINRFPMLNQVTLLKLESRGDISCSKLSVRGQYLKDSPEYLFSQPSLDLALLGNAALAFSVDPFPTDDEGLGVAALLMFTRSASSAIGTLKFHPNGEAATNMPTLYRYLAGQEIALPLTVPLSENRIFLGWSLDPDAKTAEFQAGELIPVDAVAGKTLLWLYAVWEQAEIDGLLVDLDVTSRHMATFTLTGLNRQTCSPDIVIDWNDGSPPGTYNDLPENGDTTHTYAIGKYALHITAERANLKLRENPSVISVLGELPPPVGLSDLSYMFYRCDNLVSVSETLFRQHPDATSFASVFTNCPITFISDIIFTYAPGATDFSNCFNYNRQLAALPAGLFKHNPKAANFNSCFIGCESLRTLPPTLFANNPEAINFQTCFAYCSVLEALPDNLFATNSKASNFVACFVNCSNLQNVPQALFAAEPAVKVFGNTFQNCSSISTAVPTLWQDFPQSSGGNCFQGCVAAENYDDIPAAWK